VSGQNKHPLHYEADPSCFVNEMQIIAPEFHPLKTLLRNQKAALLLTI